MAQVAVRQDLCGVDLLYSTISIRFKRDLIIVNVCNKEMIF